MILVQEKQTCCPHERKLRGRASTASTPVDSQASSCVDSGRSKEMPPQGSQTPVLNDFCKCTPLNYHAFFFPFCTSAAFAFALAAFFRLLWIMTTLRNVPTTVEPNRMRMTGIRIAQTGAGKKLCRVWSSSTKGWVCVSFGFSLNLRRFRYLCSVESMYDRILR